MTKIGHTYTGRKDNDEPGKYQHLVYQRDENAKVTKIKTEK
jgi:hypothetical protein